MKMKATWIGSSTHKVLMVGPVVVGEVTQLISHWGAWFGTGDYRETLGYADSKEEAKKLVQARCLRWFEEVVG